MRASLEIYHDRDESNFDFEQGDSAHRRFTEVPMIVSSLILATFLMHRIRNVLTNRVLKKTLGDHGTWLPIRPAVTYIYTLPLPSVAEHHAQPIA
jgi:hypothetical protein